ncbi:solute carrier family 15 member 1 [Lucilia cuprina]|uniref:solute carrier family 15 member 1 n=1 Tax=Lucilia cuprina TaxID=7375 RepID=UPI001F062E16|nr:solute carrier family 15 member 1 [Lucilia cuprina]
MFRASQIASEETLPALGVLTLKDNASEISKLTSLKSKQGNIKTEGYGLVTQLTPRGIKYPRAIIFILMAKLFEAFAANGIRSKYFIYFLVSISLLFIAIGNGSSRACLTSLGAIQFQLPQQAKQLAEYFSLYYFVYYVGIFLSKILPPMVRANTTCFNKTGCYPAVFGTLATSFFVAWLTFCIGKLYYKEEKLSEENILLKFYGCIKHALARKWSKNAGVTKRSYWLHYAVGKYEDSFVNDVAKVLKLAKLFLPLPIYFALLAQQDSSWTFQASQMNTTIVPGVTIQPDQAKAMGPIFLFILIPLWQYLMKPCLKCCFNYELQPLQSVTLGGVFSAFSFICAGVLQRYVLSMPYKSVNVLWQIPQFVLIMLGELLLSIPGLQFAFTQAPASMKSVVTAAWFINNAFGNLIVVLITELNIFPTQSDEFFFYAILMIVAIVIYTFLAYDYVLQERLGHHYASQSSLEVSVNTESTPLYNLRDETPSTSNTNTQVVNV